MKRCQKCGSPIAFKKLASGKWCPTNPDGTDHWDVCRETTVGRPIPETRRVVKCKTFVTTTRDRELLVAESGRPMEGAAFDPGSVCDCRHGVPPWEVCADCPLGIRDGIFS